MNSIPTRVLGLALATLTIAFSSIPVTAAAPGFVGFVENVGQLDATVLYTTRAPRMTAYLTGRGLVLDLREPATSTPRPADANDDALIPRDFPRSPERRGCILRILFDGTHALPLVNAHDQRPALTNFFLGAHPSDWHTGARSFSEVTYRDVWPGIDLVWRGTPGGLECEAIARPGADPEDIRFLYEGADQVLSDGDTVRLETSVGVLVHRLPVPGDRSGSLFTTGGNASAPFLRSSFDIGWCTLLGGNDEEDGFAIIPDALGRPIIAGRTMSFDFPTTPGAYADTLVGGFDTFLTKMAPDGSNVLWSTYLGGSLDDWPLAVRLDPIGNMVVYGSTLSDDFPTTPGAFDPTASTPVDDWDLFVTKLSPDADSIVWSTYLGGGKDEQAGNLVLDADGDAVLVGRTSSGSYPTTPGAYRETLCCFGNPDVFVTKLASDGTALVWSTLLGGDMGVEWSTTLTLDLQERPIVVGAADADFPTTAEAYDTSHNGGANDAFVTMLSADGDSLVWSTFVGGVAADPAFGVAVEPSGGVIVAGRTYSSNLPTTPGAFDQTHSTSGSVDSYVLCLGDDGSTLDWCTYVGGSGLGDPYPGDWMGCLALGPMGSPVIVGTTNSTDYPTTAGAPQPTFAGGEGDGFITFLNHDGSDLLWSTYCGGSDDILEGFAWWGSNVAVHGSETVFVTGSTSATDFPTYPAGVWDHTLDGEWDAVVLAIPLPTVAAPVLTGSSPARLLLTCSPNPFGDATTIRYTLPATTSVRVTVHDTGGRLVRTLQRADDVSAGTHRLSWDGHSEAGRPVAAGPYFLRVETPALQASECVVLLR